jgi:ubiquinone/menaquinone biosynthesis C-methylase UbiE
VDDTREEVKRRFGPNAERYVQSVHHASGESLDRLIALVAPRPDWRALDVATGGGHTALALSARVREVVATDLTAAMLAAAERFLAAKGAANVKLLEADAMSLPFDAAEFDLVTCRIAPHHFPDCALFVREAARVVRPGGVVAVIDNVVPEDGGAAVFINALEKTRDPSHNWAYTEREWLGFYRAAGLAVEHAERFRKARDFDVWMETMSVDEGTRARLREALLSATGAAREALRPEPAGAKLRFYLSEILIVARRPLSRGATRRTPKARPRRPPEDARGRRAS